MGDNIEYAEYHVSFQSNLQSRNECDERLVYWLYLITFPHKSTQHQHTQQHNKPINNGYDTNKLVGFSTCMLGQGRQCLKKINQYLLSFLKEEE